MTPTRRRQKLIQPHLQLRLVVSFALVSGVALAMQSVLFATRLSELATQMPAGGEHVTRMAPGIVREVLFFSFGVFLPITFALGVAVTSRIAGPLHRFEQHLSQVALGEDPGPCKIRAGDQLQRLGGLINDALSATRTGAHAPKTAHEAHEAREDEPKELNAAA